MEATRSASPLRASSGLTRTWSRAVDALSERAAEVRLALAAGRALDRAIPAMPAVGRLGSAANLLAFRENGLALLRHADRVGPVARVDLLYRATVFVKDPDAIAAMFDTQDAWERGEGLVPLIGRNVLTSNGEAWATARRLAQPTFHPKMTDRHAAVFGREATPFVEAWDRFAAERATVDLAAELVRIFARLATRAFGFDLTEADAERFPEAMIRLQRWAFRVVAGGHVRTPQAAADMAFVDGLVARAFAGPAPTEGPPSYLERLRQDLDVDRARLRDHAMIALIAPADNPPNACAFALWLLARHPEIEAAVRREIAAVVGGEAPTPDAIERMPLLERVLFETMRFYPPVWLLARHARADTTLLGFRVPAGTLAWAPPFFVHRNPAHWDEPEAFRPDRFLPAAVERRHRHAYLPFGAGPRMCIGARFATLEARLALVLVLQRFRVRPADDAPLELEGSFGLRSRRGLPVQLERVR